MEFTECGDIHQRRVSLIDLALPLHLVLH